MVDVEETKRNLLQFSYFQNWDSKTIEELCKITKKKSFLPNQIVISENIGWKTFVYFIIEGNCCVIEELTLQVIKKTKNNKVIYKLIKNDANKFNFQTQTIERRFLTVILYLIKVLFNKSNFSGV